MTLIADESATACPHCRDTGWVVEQDKEGSPAKPCPHCRGARRADSLLSRAGIPPRFLNRGFEDFRPISEDHPRAHRLQTRALKTSIEFVEGFPATEGGLLFVGPCGVGKTHLSVAILKALIEEKQASGRFVDETELLRRLQYSYNPGSVETEKEVLEPLMKADLVVWDDLGASRPTDWVRETMRTVINHRYTHNRATIFTTNWPLLPAEGGKGPASPGEETLSERIGRRVYSRILEMAKPVRLDGPDFRIQTRSGRAATTSKQEAEFPSALVRCQRCEESNVTRLGLTPVKNSERGPFVESYWRCQGCGHDFLALFFPESETLEYPANPSEQQ